MLAHGLKTYPTLRHVCYQESLSNNSQQPPTTTALIYTTRYINVQPTPVPYCSILFYKYPYSILFYILTLAQLFSPFREILNRLYVNDISILCCRIILYCKYPFIFIYNHIYMLLFLSVSYVVCIHQLPQQIPCRRILLLLNKAILILILILILIQVQNTGLMLVFVWAAWKHL